MESNILLELHNTLVQHEYPGIGNVKIQNVRSLLSGNNYVRFLLWIIQEKVRIFHPPLDKIKGVTLQGELSKLFSNLGMCLDKNLFSEPNLSNSKLRTIQNLIELINSTNKSNNEPPGKEQCFLESTKEYLKRGMNTTSITDSQIIYSDENTFVSNIQKEIQQSDDTELETPQNSANETLASKGNLGKETMQDDNKCLENFISAVESLEAVPTSKSSDEFSGKATKSWKNLQNDLSSISPNFTTVYKEIQNKNEMLNIRISLNLKEANPQEIDLQDTVVLTTKVCNAFKDLAEQEQQ